MTKSSNVPAQRFQKVRTIFSARDLIVHDGQTLRRFRIDGRRQGALAAAAIALVGFGSYGVASASADVAKATGVIAPTASEAQLAAMEAKVAAMHNRVVAIRAATAVHAARVEQRQALLAAAITGTGDARKMALATLATDPQTDRLAGKTLAPLTAVEGRQVALAAEATKLLQTRYRLTAQQIRQLGLNPKRVAKHGESTAMGGPLIDAASAEASADLKADAQFRTLFQTWKKLDGLQQGSIAIPSVQPVQHLSFTSNFGIRSDPFRGTSAMHAGVDIPGPTGTPVYATADGIVDHAARQGGYGNMVEINHGKGIATRYGHLSKILVADNTRVKRGQLIALMGSTGRSTGPHLHYEVRIDGHAVNPIPFLTTGDYLLAAQDRAVGAIPVSTGPAPLD